MKRLICYELYKLICQRFGKAAIGIAMLLCLLSAMYSTGLFYELSHPQMVSAQYYAMPRYKENIFYHYSEPYSEIYHAKVTYEMQRLREQQATLTEAQKAQAGKYGLTQDMDTTLFADLYRQWSNIVIRRQSVRRFLLTRRAFYKQSMTPICSSVQRLRSTPISRICICRPIIRRALPATSSAVYSSGAILIRSTS